MLMDLHFGDYYNDGHGRYHTVTVEIPNEQHLHAAIAQVKEKYPNFFDTFCHGYEDQSIGPDVEKALLETDYPAEKFAETNDDVIWDQFETLSQLFSSEIWADAESGQGVTSINFVVDATVWVLNAFGAEITVMPKNPSHEFSSGYGMFY